MCARCLGATIGKLLKYIISAPMTKSTSRIFYNMFLITLMIILYHHNNKFAEHLENVAPYRKPYQNLASIIHLSLVPYYDHTTHWKHRNIPNLLIQRSPFQFWARYHTRVMDYDEACFKHLTPGVVHNFPKAVGV